MAGVMDTTARQYVEFCEGDYFVPGSRVLLDGIISEFLDGRSPETIRQSFPTLTLAEIYGALAFYLDHQPEIDAYLQQRETAYEARRQSNISQNPEFHEKLRMIQGINNTFPVVFLASNCRCASAASASGNVFSIRSFSSPDLIQSNNSPARHSKSSRVAA